MDGTDNIVVEKEQRGVVIVGLCVDENDMVLIVRGECLGSV